MKPIIIKASQFSKRADIESAIRSQCGQDISSNRSVGHSISGTADELKALGLSADSSVYGVKCVLTG